MVINIPKSSLSTIKRTKRKWELSRSPMRLIKQPSQLYLTWHCSHHLEFSKHKLHATTLFLPPCTSFICFHSLTLPSCSSLVTEVLSTLRNKLHASSLIIPTRTDLLWPQHSGPPLSIKFMDCFQVQIGMYITSFLLRFFKST